MTVAGIFERLSSVFRSKAYKALDKSEDPHDRLDYSYQRQLELLQRIRRGIADLATSRKRVESHAARVGVEMDRLTLSAQRALEQGQEDLAREALSRKAFLANQLAELQAHHTQFQQEEEKLVRASVRLQTKVDAFRMKKEMLKATYSAAEAQARISEAFSGISEEMGDAGMIVRRAEDTTLRLQACAGTADELLSFDVFDDPRGIGQDGLARELDSMISDAAVETELAQMRAQLMGGENLHFELPTSGSRFKQLPASGTRSDIQDAGEVK